MFKRSSQSQRSRQNPTTGLYILFVFHNIARTVWYFVLNFLNLFIRITLLSSNCSHTPAFISDVCVDLTRGGGGGGGTYILGSTGDVPTLGTRLAYILLIFQDIISRIPSHFSA